MGQSPLLLLNNLAVHTSLSNAFNYIGDLIDTFVADLIHYLKNLFPMQLSNGLLMRLAL